jgi:hypothetical protein
MSWFKNPKNQYAFLSETICADGVAVPDQRESTVFILAVSAGRQKARWNGDGE